FIRIGKGIYHLLSPVQQDKNAAIVRFLDCFVPCYADLIELFLFHRIFHFLTMGPPKSNRYPTKKYLYE
ncbi:hypothetical protein, partial [Candidatus Bealeia paramacronuclearis]|uniref:hypothetical protein n=1 Tax=Candidatus Bealeia paramacronuclearis TaxID=1921001 RepID=UPI0030CC07E7